MMLKLAQFQDKLMTNFVKSEVLPCQQIKQKHLKTLLFVSTMIFHKSKVGLSFGMLH